jgi:hypothetical protein
MERLTRRSVLLGGGAIAATAALSACRPNPDSPWTWSPTGSIPGSGTGADPRYVWDPEADELVRSLLDRGDVPAANQELRKWTTNGQALPAGLPSDLKDFIEKARQLPPWADSEKLVTAANFNQKRGLYLGVTYGFASGMMSTIIPHEARAVYYSKGGADMKDRITKTAKLGYDVGSYNAFRPDGEMIVTCVKTRLAHAGVRNLLPRSQPWSTVADEDIPISQRDLMVTWHSLPTTVMQNLVKWKVPIPPDESEGFLHSWQLTAHLLGVLDEYIPKSWGEANAQAEQVLTPLLAPTPEGIKLAHMLLDLGSQLDGGFITRPILGSLTRFVLGDGVAEWLEIPRDGFWDPVFANAWEPFVAVREGILALEHSPGVVQEVYWDFDELLRLGALLYLSDFDWPISIQIPVGNNPNIPDATAPTTTPTTKPGY